MKHKLYVGCSLTQASEPFKESVERFKAALRENGYEVFDFVGLVNGTEEDVYNWDIGHCVKDCDALIAICDEPSIGLGWEMATAVRLGKPVLALAHQTAKVTRLVLGAAVAESNLEFVRYEDLNEAVSLVDKLLADQLKA
jgi:nucleoside 2-deoxyribosyltransferase